MKHAVIKCEQQYKSAIDRLDELVAIDPCPDSPEGSELELLSLLIEDYEVKKFDIEKPDPVEFIEYVMHEQDLRQVDLVPYFGSRSRVSEFLSRKRPLTVQMIRELSAGLGIPAEILIQDSTSKEQQGSPEQFDWSKLPLKEMLSRGWISCNTKATQEQIKEKAKEFIEKVLGETQSPVFARRSIKGDALSWKDDYSLIAWQARVLEKSDLPENQPTRKFEISKIDSNFFLSLAKLSKYDDGPVRAVSFLKENGISTVIEKHLPKTKLDGAAMISRRGIPTIGLTLRFDRVDYFWFTLMHELVHIWKHLSNPGDAFLDRIEDKESTDDVEKEANRIARDFLIPRAAWKTSNLRSLPTKSGINDLANKLEISPAIVAGRVRKENGNYSQFTDMVGQGSVSNLF